MKLPNSNADYMMEDLSMEKDVHPISRDRVDQPVNANRNTYLQLTPSTAASLPSIVQRHRRNTVSVACERCRKRKTKCSGLPGPCTNCTRLNVPCYEPGRRKTTVQSTLEERMQRLKTLTAANRFAIPDQNLQTLEGYDIFGQPSTEHHRTNTLSAADSSFFLPNTAQYELGVPSPTSAHSSEDWAAATNPASYFDSALQESMDWNMPDYSHDSASMVSRDRAALQDVPLPPSQEPNQATWPSRAVSSSIADPMHATQDTNSGLAAQSGSSPRERTPIGFTISYDADFFDDIDQKPGISIPTTPSSEKQEQLDDEHDDILRSNERVIDRPEQHLQFSTVPTTQSGPLTEQHGSIGHQLTRSQTVPMSFPMEAKHESSQETGLLHMIIQSSDTQKFIEVYFASAQKEYPFLNRSIFEQQRSLAEYLSLFNNNLAQQHLMVQFQALIIASIGALVQHESTNLSSQYVKQALTIRDQIDMWSSVGGVHCALLLALYCYLAQIMVYDTRQDETAEAHLSQGTSRQNRYPVSNLWLHNCQIAAACIDLGMRQPLAMQEQIRSQSDIKMYLEACSSTIRSAYILDRKISELRNRPRAFHDEDIDPILLSGL